MVYMFVARTLFYIHSGKCSGNSSIFLFWEIDTQAIVCVLFSFLISTYFPKMAESSVYLYAKVKVSPEGKAGDRKRERMTDGTKFLGDVKGWDPKDTGSALSVSGARHSSGMGGTAAKGTTDGRQQRSRILGRKRGN